MSIPSGFLAEVFAAEIPVIGNWALLVLIPDFIFYFRLSFSMGFKVFLFAVFCIVGNYFISLTAALWLVSLIIFAVARIGQFYGHKIEGKKTNSVLNV